MIFSCMFIEQKHGWGDIFSGIPVLGIKDSKKRVIEYVLNLDTIDAEKKKEELKFEEARIRNEWTVEIRELQNAVNRETCSVSGVPLEPCEFTQITAEGIHIFKEKKRLGIFIQELKDECKKLETIKPRVIDNFDELQNELEETEKDIEQFEEEVYSLRSQLSKENAAILVLNDNLEIIETDLQNNKDAAKLRQLGSEIGCKSFENICPVCNQPISDSLLPVIEETEIMSIDENIRHLEAQKVMLSYARESHYGNKKAIDERLQLLQGKIFSLRRLAMALRNDIYSINDNMSESIIYKKIDFLNKIEKLEVLQKFVAEKVDNLLTLGKDWKKMLDGKKKVPSKKFSASDYDKIEKADSLLELLPEDNKMVNRISIKNVQDLCTALEVSYQLDDKRKREKDALVEELKKNIKNTIAEFVKEHNEIDVNKETTISSAFQYLDYTLKQKILTLYNENSDVVNAIVSKYSLPSVNENSITSFVKLRNNKTHSGTVEWGESANIYVPLFAIVYASFFKYIELPHEVIKSTLLRIF